MTQRGDIPMWLAWVLSQETDECLLWPFRVGTHGYGEMRRDGQHWLVHRWICAQTWGCLPGFDAAHSCGHATCANKRHLRWASRAGNHHDKIEHGTHVFGERLRHALLTDVAVAEIRRAARTRGTGAALARKFGVHPNTIYAARSRTWRHVA